MKNIKFFIIGMISLLILIGFIFDYYTVYPMFPQEYDNYTFLLSIFNILFGGTFIFGIYRWNIERKEKQQDDFIKKIDELSEKALKITSFKVGEKFKNMGFSISVIEGFNGFDFTLENDILICKSKKNKEFNFKSLFENLGELDDYLYDFSNLINYIYIKRELILSNSNIQEYLRYKLVYFSNIHFYYSLFLLHFIAGNNIESNAGTDINNKYLTINNKKSHKKILKFNKYGDKVLELLEILK